jgi:YD repeat-containing protein
VIPLAAPATTRRRAATVLALVVALAAVFASLPADAQVRYVYDDLGRVVGVIDPSGESATYVYDAVGNLLSITRSTAAVQVLSFSPQAGPVGTTVTIAGAGFSTTPSNNTVTFNGTTATVVSSTANQIVTTVPTGATTGTIAVTSPSGSATSSASFTVTSGGPAAPTITGFTPTTGAAGTSVSVSGTNFNTLAINNKVLFNTTLAPVTSATSTSIAAPVPPGATSGRLSVKTPYGTAVSSSDFIIPPAPFGTGDVQTTGRLAFGTATQYSITTANKIALVLFDGVKNQRISLRMSSVTIGWSYITIIKPDSTTLVSSYSVSSGGGFIDTLTLPLTGTYTILIDPDSTYTGNMTLTLYDVPADVSSTITAGGSAVSVTITTPGQNAGVTFSGTQNQRISLNLTNVTAYSYVSILKPDGTNLVAPTWTGGSGFFDAVALPTTGTYKVFVDPSSTYTGNATLTLYDVPADVSTSITAGGSAVSVTITTPGQNANVTFSGTQNQRVSLLLTSVTAYSDVSIKKPDGTNLVAPTWVGGSGFIDTQTLPATGTYTIFVNPYATYSGNVTLTLYDVAGDVSTTITPGGSPVTVTTTSPGQNAGVTFSGTQNQRVSLRVTNATAYADVSIRNPNGTTLAGPSWMGSSGYLDAVTLPTTGTYTIFVNPSGTYTGNNTLTLYDVVDASGTLTIGGGTVAATITVPGQNGALTFSGTQSQQVTVHVTSNTLGYTTVTLRKPDGTTLTTTATSASSFNLSTQTLPVTGTFTVFVNPDSYSTGSLNVSVTSP